MPGISPHDMEYYRSLVAAVDLPEDRKDECIHTVFNIVCSFVDQAFGIHSAQLSLKDRANPCFSGKSKDAMVIVDPETEPVDLDNEGAINSRYSRT